MNPRRPAGRVVGIDALASHPDRIDVRSPSEFAEDHLPGAVNCPVLDDDERARVGTLHNERGAFEANKVGAAIVARRIAGIVEDLARDKPRGWAPLVCCWRGGKRSGSLVHVLNEIGFPAVRLDGGYRTWRRHVVERLEALPATFRFRVVCGLTGSGKSRLLAALAAEGANVLDLERLARHRGSLLGDLPGEPQPSQKAFETALHEALAGFDRERPVWVESESRKIGALQVPERLLAEMRAAPCVRVDLDTRHRVALLEDEYAHFLADPEALVARLAHLKPLVGQATLDRWAALAHARAFDRLVADLLDNHYDPTYARGMVRNYAGFATAEHVAPANIDPAGWRDLALRLAAAGPR